MIEKAYVINNLEDLSLLPRDSNRVYIGSEYCVKAFPLQLEKIIKESKKLMPISLITPPLLECELNTFFKYLHFFEMVASKDDELIINDWGVMGYVTSNEQKIYKLRLGRFLTYQKRGTQKRNNLVQDSSLSDIPVLDKKTVEYLINIGINGIDIDLPLYKINLPENLEMSIAVCLPYAVNSYTINCPFTFNGKKWGRKCKRECLKIKMFYNNQEVEEPFFQKGKVYYTKSHFIDLPFVKRIINFEWNQ